MPYVHVNARIKAAGERLMRYILASAETLSNYPPEMIGSMEASLPDSFRKRFSSIKPGQERSVRVLSYYLLEGLFLKAGINEPYILEEIKYGKPVLSGRPDISFSISHSGRYAAVAVYLNDSSENCSVGIDVEDLGIQGRPEKNLLKMARRFFMQQDRSFIRKSSDVRESFFRIWTMKEASTKAKNLMLSDVFKSEPYSVSDPYMVQMLKADAVLTIYMDGREIGPGDVLLSGTLMEGRREEPLE